MARRMTLDQLAAIMARGFEEIRGEFDGLRREMRERFASLQAVVDGHTATLAGHGEILASHGEILASHGEILASHGEILRDHTYRLDRIERKLDATIRLVDDHDVRIQALERRRPQPP